MKLRALEPNDLELLYEIENDERFWYLGSVTAPYSMSVLEQYLDNAHLDIYTTKQQRFVIDVEGIAIGFIDLYDFDPKNKRAGVGIIILEDYKCKGYATSALELLIDYSRNVLSLHQLFASIPKNNIASIKLFEKLSFQKTGIKKDWLLHNQLWEDAIDFQLLF